jgi:hypothetical protein
MMTTISTGDCIVRELQPVVEQRWPRHQRDDRQRAAQVALQFV